ncbi:MAG: nucleotidyltransferase family protein [Fimbriimonadales bacterium]
MISNSEPTCGIVLAGGAIDPDWAKASGASSRALVPVAGVPMFRRVVEALRGVPTIDTVLVVGQVPVGTGYQTLPPADTLLENVRIGLEHSPHESVLFTTVDVPFLTAESVAHFLEQSLQSGASLTYAVVPAEVCRERFPQMKRTTVRLREGELTGGNLFWVRREVALRELPRLRALYEARKQPVRLASQIGLGLLLQFLMAKLVSPRLLSVRQIERRVERILGVPVKAILTPYAEVGTDIDRLEHWELVR